MFPTKFKISEFHENYELMFAQTTNHTLDYNARNFRRRKAGNGLESETEFQTFFGRAKMEGIPPIFHLYAAFPDNFIKHRVAQRWVIMK